MKIRIITSLLMMVMCGSTWASNPNLEQQANQDSLLQEQTKQIIAEQKEREMLYLRELEHNAEKRAHIIQLSKLIDKERAKLSKTDSKQKHSVSDDAIAERCMANIKAWQDEISSIRLTNPNTSIKFLSPSRHKNASSSTPESTAKSTAKAMSQALASQSAKHERVDTIHDGNDILTYRYNNIGQVVECVYVDLYRYTYAYDDNGNRITEIRDNIATDEYGKKYWLPSSMKNMKYDSMGKYTMTEQYTYTNGEWVGSSKTENYYDADGYNCGTTQYLWDAEEQAWTISSHRKSTYNSHDNLTEYVNYSCRYGYSGEKQIYVYSDDDILLESASYSMSNNGEWVLTEKTVSELGDYGIAKTEYYTSSGNVGTTPALDKVIIYLYDEEGNRTGEETDVMQDGNLVGQSKSEYFASDKKNLEIEYEWNNDQWMVSYYNKTLFDDNNETIYQECYYASEGVKDYGSKTECTETQEGDNVKKVMTYYEIEQGEWHVVSKSETLLDTQNRELEKISYYLYESTLEPSSKTVNEYQDNKHFHYEYHWYGDQWRLFNAYGYHYTYDSNGKVIKETNMRLNGEWVETNNYTTYTYDNNGNLLALITYYNNTESYRKEITYDDNGNQLLLTEYNYSVPTQRSENQYDQNGNLAYSASYYYVNNQWQKIGYEYTYQYNTAGERVATQSFNWYDGEISGGSYSHEETDDHNRTTIYEYYTNYTNGHWSSGRKDVNSYAYNGDEALTLLSESYTMQSDGTLKGISKVARSYDTQYNLLTEYKYDGWDNNTSDFILVSEKVYTRRDDGQVLTYDYATYANGVKTGKDKYTNTYDNNGHVTEYTKYNWNTTYKDWVNGYRTVYQWDDHDNVTLYETYYYSKNTWKKNTNYTLTYDTSVNLQDVCGKDLVRSAVSNADIKTASKPLTINASGKLLYRFKYSECQHYTIDITRDNTGMILVDKQGTYKASNGTQMHTFTNEARIITTEKQNIYLAVNNANATLNVTTAGNVLYTGVPEDIVTVEAPLGMTEITLTDANGNIIPLTGLSWKSGDETYDQKFEALKKQFLETLQLADSLSQNTNYSGKAELDKCRTIMHTYKDNNYTCTDTELTVTEMLESKLTTLSDAIKAYKQSADIAFKDEVDLLNTITADKGYHNYLVKDSHIYYVDISQLQYTTFPYQLLTLPYIDDIYANDNHISEFIIPEGEQYNRNCNVYLYNQDISQTVNLSVKECMNNTLNVWNKLPQILTYTDDEDDKRIIITIANSLDTSSSKYSTVTYTTTKEPSPNTVLPLGGMRGASSNGELWLYNNTTYYLTTGICDNTEGSHMRVKISVEPGDANLDGAVDVADIQTVINYILRNSMYQKTPINYPSANRNADNAVNVLDIIGITNDILADTPSAAKGVKGNDASAAVDAVGKSAVYIQDNTLYVNATEPIASFDIQMSAAADIQWLECLDGFTITTRNGHTVAYNMDGRTLPAGPTAVATIVSGKPVLLAATLVSAEAKRVPCAITGTTTSIDNVCTDAADAVYYNIAGQRISARKNGISIIKTNNNLTKKIAR